MVLHRAGTARRLAEEFEIELDLRAFFLHPEIPPEGMKRQRRHDEPEGGLAPRIAGLAEEERLVMRRAPLTPYTMLAQAATEHAKRFGLAERFHRLAYRAYWEDGANLGDLAVLKALAVEAGLDWDDLEPRLEAREYDRLLQDQHDEALRIGIHGVPGFLVDDSFWFTGAQPIEMFRLVARKALDARSPEEGEGGPGIGVRIGEG